MNIETYQQLQNANLAIKLIEARRIDSTFIVQIYKKENQESDLLIEVVLEQDRVVKITGL